MISTVKDCLRERALNPRLGLNQSNSRAVIENQGGIWPGEKGQDTIFEQIEIITSVGYIASSFLKQGKEEQNKLAGIKTRMPPFCVTCPVA